MSKDKGFEFTSVGIAKVLSSNTLRIPKHQRDYAWRTDEVVRLLEDLASAKDKNIDYFLGTIVTIDKGDDVPLEVVDGQQRLTTTYLLLCAIRDYLREIDRGENIVTSLDTVTLNVPDRKLGKIPRLTLNTDDAEFFKQLTQPDVDYKSLTPSRDSHDLLLDASKETRKWTQKVVALVDKNSADDLLDGWITYLEQDAQVVLLKAANGARAFKMFETLNDRGMKTSQADLVKSYLFGESGDRLDEAQVAWSSMLDILQELSEDEKSLTFLRHLLIATRQFVRSDKVYEAIQGTLKGESSSASFLSDLRRYASVYVATFRGDHEYWSGYSTTAKRALVTFNRFDLKPMRPLVFAIAERFTKTEFAKALTLLASISVRLVVTSKTRTGANEQAFAAAALGVYEKNIEDTATLKSHLSGVIVSNADFEEAFEKARVSNAGLARYYLRALEGVIAKDPEPQFVVNEDESVVTLEHVFPKNPDDGSWPLFVEEDRRRYRTRLGNLCLLQKTPNNDMPNDSFAKKRPFLEASEYKLTEAIAGDDDWGPENIDVRQEQLAQLALKAWKI